MHRFFGKYILRIISMLFLFGASGALANPTLDVDATDQEIEELLSGSGLTIKPGSLSVIVGQNNQYGIFTNGTRGVATYPTIGLETGFFLTTGDALGTDLYNDGNLVYGSGGRDLGSPGRASHAILGPNDATGSSSVLGISYTDPELTALTPSAVYDPAIVTMDVTPQHQYIKVYFVFASEEYPDYVCARYENNSPFFGDYFNDSFGFFIRKKGTATWQNIALVPGTNFPISVNTINNGSCGVGLDDQSPTASNSHLYIDNGADNIRAADSGQVPYNANLQYDGLTVPLTVDAQIDPGAEYEIKMAIADAADGYTDAGVFIQLLGSSQYTADTDLSLSSYITTSSVSAPQEELGIILEVNSVGLDEASNTVVSFPLPEGFSWVSDTSSGAYNPQTGLWSVPDISAGGSQRITITAQTNAQATNGSAAFFAELLEAEVFDFDSLPGNGPQNPPEDDEVSFQIDVSATDYSDLPAHYDVASHTIVSDFRLGAIITADVPGGNADVGDDGITFPIFTGDIPVLVHADVIGSGGRLHGWVDWNQDGDFDELGERIAFDIADQSSSDLDPEIGKITFSVTPPGNIPLGMTYALFRWSSAQQAVTPDNLLSDGEAESYPALVSSTFTDVSLDVSVTEELVIGEPFTFTASVTNGGNIPTVGYDALNAVNGLEVTLALPAGYVYSSHREEGLGSYDPITGIWQIMPVMPGDSRNLHITAIPYVGGVSGAGSIEVTRLATQDPDSTAGNGNVPGEDDYQELVFDARYIGQGRILDPHTCGGDASLLRSVPWSTVSNLAPNGDSFTLPTPDTDITGAVIRTPAASGVQADFADVLTLSGQVSSGSVSLDLSPIISGQRLPLDNLRIPVSALGGIGETLEVFATYRGGSVPVWMDGGSAISISEGQRRAVSLGTNEQGDAASVMIAFGGLVDVVRLTFSVPVPGNALDVQIGDIAYCPESSEQTLRLGADQKQSVSPGASVIYGYMLQTSQGLDQNPVVLETYSDNARQWSIFRDNGDGVFGPEDTPWNNQALLSADTQYMVWLKSTVPATAGHQWRDITTLEAYVPALRDTTTVITRSITYATGENLTQGGNISGEKFVALDIGCDGLADDGEVFLRNVPIAPGQCALYRITYQNTGIAEVTGIMVRDSIPIWTRYIANSAMHVLTPQGLQADVPSVPADGRTGPVLFPLTGALLPGASGTVQFAVRLDQDP